MNDDDDHLRRLARVGFDAGMTVHDLSNVVGAVIGYAQLAHMTGDPADYRQAVDVIEPALQRARQSIARFKADADGVGVVAPVDLGAFVASVIAELEPEILRAGHEIELRVERSATVLVKPVDQATAIAALVVHIAARHVSPCEIRLDVRVADGSAVLRIRSRPLDASAAATRSMTLSAAEWDLIRKVVIETDLRLVDDDTGGPGFGYHLSWPIPTA
ncbi:MAG: hypothetical protein KJ042_07390 [Deltaproteobacteria bacterium]|nr:hypothetical protein [Deltaproteobacteria bacterium]